ncbi:MAG TPA: condensation domain-containing protein [Streptosporangiaceae bacterium]|jgi:hypothetical protein
MFARVAKDRIVVEFSAATAGTAPLTWGQKAILQDMRDSGSQLSMGGMADLPEGGTAQDAAAWVSRLMRRHAALRMRLGTDDAGRPCQVVAGSGQLSLDILTIPDDADAAGFAEHLMATWPLKPFDFRRDWPLRMAMLRHRTAGPQLVWVLSHLAADGGAHMLLADDLLAASEASASSEPQHPDILDIARSEQQPQVRQLSSRAMRHWESQLRRIPPLTFGEGRGQGRSGRRCWQARFSSPAAHLAILAIARRTGTDVSSVTLAVIATAIGRASGDAPLTVGAMVNNRFRPGMANVIAPIAQNSVVTIDVTDTSLDEVVARSRAASMTGGMRAYYDPDDLAEVTARLDAERGYPTGVTYRVNDQRAMVVRADAAGTVGEVTSAQVTEKLGAASLTWLGPREDAMRGQVSVRVENQADVLTLHVIWDRCCLTDEQVEALLHATQQVAVEAVHDAAAPTRVAAARA